MKSRVPKFGSPSLCIRAADEGADFIPAFTVGLNDLETGCDVSFDGAAIGLGLDHDEVASRRVVGARPLRLALSLVDKPCDFEGGFLQIPDDGPESSRAGVSRHCWAQSARGPGE